MPAYSATIPDLEHSGPTLDIEILPSEPAMEYLQQHGITVERIRLHAMIDTGSSSSVIRAGMLDSFGIFPTNIVQVNTPTSADISCDVYALQLLLPDHHDRSLSIDVIEAPLHGQNIQFLIGRDVLQFGVFIYQGHIDSFTLSF